jgi:hypothetical protein
MGNRISSREGFVSDNLVNLGKRLQVNYELKESGNGFSEDLPAPEREKLAARRAIVERSEAERMYRELRDRIANSAAAAGAELEQLDAIRKELESYAEMLGESTAALEKLDPASDTAIRDIEEIRFRYFTASGRAQTFFGGRASVQSDPGTPEEIKTFSTLLYESLPVVLAILFGSLIVGVAFMIALM